jgi:hypothetical protein
MAASKENTSENKQSRSVNIIAVCGPLTEHVSFPVLRAIAYYTSHNTGKRSELALNDNRRAVRGSMRPGGDPRYTLTNRPAMAYQYILLVHDRWLYWKLIVIGDVTCGLSFVVFSGRHVLCRKSLDTPLIQK